MFYIIPIHNLPITEIRLQHYNTILDPGGYYASNAKDIQFTHDSDSYGQCWEMKEESPDLKMLESGVPRDSYFYHFRVALSFQGTRPSTGTIFHL